MTIKIANDVLGSCQTIEQVVALINDEMASDASAEMIAAKYAHDAAVDSGYISDDNIEAQLESLFEAGAIFDFASALEMAIDQKKH